MERCRFFTYILVLAACGNRDGRAKAPIRSDAFVPAPVEVKDAAPAAGSASAPAPGARVWTFDSDAAGSPPAGFSFGLTGQGRQGRWVVQATADAPSAGQTLIQSDADPTNNRFPLAVASDSTAGDVRASVRCKAISGTVDQACGLIVRYRDASNYYITRANALEGNVRLYYVKDGRRVQIATATTVVKTGVWHSLVFEVRGDHLVVSWDGSNVIDHHDSTFSGPGAIGVWTKADSVTAFDDLTFEPLAVP